MRDDMKDKREDMLSSDSGNSIPDLPQMTFSGDAVKSLPAGLHVAALYLENCPFLESLPEDLDVQYLSITDCPKLSHFPDGLHLAHLYAFASNLEEVPQHSSCLVQLVLMDCKNLKKLSDRCVVFARDLCLNGCVSLAELPHIKLVHGSLDVSFTKISHLPENLMIGEDLLASGSALETLPPGLRVGRNLFLDSCKNLHFLPEGLTVFGDLDLSESGIRELPSHCTIAGNLNITATAITELPADLLVGGKIIGGPDAWDCRSNSKELPADLPGLIWQGSGYIYCKGVIYRILEQGEGFWKVADPHLNVYRMVSGNDVLFADSVYYLVSDASASYGIGHTLEEARQDLQH